MLTLADFESQLRASIAKDDLAAFVEETSGYKLHPWQVILCARLEKLKTQKGQRILIHKPPQTGGSQIVSKRLPAWLLWNDPLLRIILAAYNKTHAGGLIDSAKMAGLHEIVSGAIVWPKSNDDDGTFTAQRLKLNDAQPSLIGVGLDSGFTGKNGDCFVAGTKIATEFGSVNIEDIYPGFVVKGYNVLNGNVELRSVIATRSVKAKELICIRTESGKSFVCTPDHPIFTGNGKYIPAREMGQGDRILSLHGMREDNQSRAIRSSKSGETKRAIPVLHSCLRDGIQGEDSGQKMPYLRCSDAESERSEVLLNSVYAEPCSIRSTNLPSVPEFVSADKPLDITLQSGLREHYTLGKDEGRREFKVQGWTELREVVPADAPIDIRAGVGLLRGVHGSCLYERDLPQDKQNENQPSRSPYRRQQERQFSRESNPSLCEVPLTLPQETKWDTISRVERIHCEGERVYDIQVEGTSNFFAEGILVHNCLIIDDPYPNAEDSRSEAYNRKVQSFWKETAEPRIMANPSSNVVVMFHRYHENDIAGFLMKQSDEWEVITFPAIADGNPNDPTGRELGELLSPFHTLDALEKKRADDPKTFAGQFQGVPKSDTEGLFQESMFEYVEAHEVPPLRTLYRGWDTAAKAKQSNDPTACVKFGIDSSGSIWVLDAFWKWLNWSDLCACFASTCHSDGMTTIQAVEDASSGVQLFEEMVNPATRPEMAGYTIESVSHGNKDKRFRASPIATRAAARTIKVVKFPAHREFVNHLTTFDGHGLGFDHTVDAFSTAWSVAFREQGETLTYGIENRIARHLRLSTSVD